MLDALKQISGGLLDLVLPQKCLLCEDGLGSPFCAACREDIEPVGDEAPIPEYIADARVVGLHQGKLREAVLKLKFGRKVALADPLGELIAAEFLRVQPSWKADVLIPVPIHWTRRLERGFNQSELLVEPIRYYSGVPIHGGWLARRRRTPHQVGQTRGQRAEALKGAFTASSEVAGKRVVLVDDVRTTGATLSHCADALRKAGASEVFALTVTWDE